MDKKAANAKMRSLYGAAWFERPDAKQERDNLMRGGATRASARTSRPAATRKERPRRAARPVDVAEVEEAEVAPPPRSRSSRSASAPPSGVMLAKAWSGSDPTGWWMSEKLDGMRAYWTGDAFYTRNGNPIAVPDWFAAIFPAGVALDGELYLDRGRFQDTISIVRKATASDPRWSQIRYMAFDAPEVPGGCEVRFRKLQAVVDAACRAWTRRGPCPLVFVEQTRCASPAALEKMHAQIERLRGEGVMLRRPGSPYSRTRTPDLLKVKSFADEEARIVGHTRGTGKHAGKLGAYEATLLSSGVRFKIGTGISDHERSRPLPVGTIVTVRFQELTRDGVPRFPSLVGTRDYD